MADIVVEVHLAPACGPGEHNPKCATRPGDFEICEDFGGLCVCVHYPPVENFRSRDGKPDIKVVDNRERR